MVRLAMMIPLRRCGSNAVRLRLNLNPHVYSPYPLHLTDMMDKVPLYGDLSDDRNYFRLIVDFLGLQTLSLIRWPVVFDPVVVFRELVDLPERSIHQIYGHLLTKIGGAKGVSVVLDKSQDSVRYFEDYVRLFPDIVFIDLVRDPRGQISSMNRAIIYDFHTRLNTERWIESRQWADKIREKYPEKILTIRYEDFVASEEETLCRICGFLQIPFTNEMMDIHRSDEARHMSALSPLWETNAATTSTRNVYKFLSHLSMDEIEAIETTTLPWMKQFHYEPITPHRHGFRHSLRDVLDRNTIDKEKAWKHLKVHHYHDYVLRRKRQWYISSLTKETTEL